MAHRRPSYFRFSSVSEESPINWFDSRILMIQQSCVSCRTVRGEIHPPGGILYENEHWMMFLRSRPPLVAGQGFIVLKRHCENVAELTTDEQALLGVIMTKTAQAMMAVLKPEKMHFGLHAERVKHIHMHITPRTAELPAGNIPLVWLSSWYGLVERLKLRQPISDATVAAVAEGLRGAFREI